MSAIAGILFLHGTNAQPGLIATLTGAMKDSGPDEQRHWGAGPVVLGHCMLRTTPESLEEQQPGISGDGHLALVWDGRLDNRDELLACLGNDGTLPRNRSDAELVLQAYATWGESVVDRLLGDFAFAVWDAAQERLFCARDAMGARPFFYTRTDAFFAFASEDDALVRLPGVSPAPDEERIAYFLDPYFLGFDPTRSWVREVRAIGAGQCMTVQRDGVQPMRTYWELQPQPETRYASDAECEAAFLEVFGEAVRCRMRTTSDVAAMLSGGLDSASIAATAKRLLPEMPGKALHSYSAISDDVQSCVESQCILALTRDLGPNAHRVSVPSFEGMLSAQDLVDIGWSRAHPIDNSLLLPAMMCVAAARAGHRVMLTGVCGDLTTQSSYPYLLALLRAGKWRQAWSESHAASANHTSLQGEAGPLIFARSAYRAFAPAWLLRTVRHLRRQAPGPGFGSLVGAALAERVGSARWRARREREAPPLVTGLKQAHIRSLRPPHGIASSIGGYHRVAAKCGVELRDPWADRRVVEFWLRLPMKYKFRGGWTKYLVRASLHRELPAEVAWRVGKQHVGWNFLHRLMDESADRVAETLERGLGAVDNFVDPDTARRIYAASLAGDDHDTLEKVFDVVTLVSWVRGYRNTG